MSQHASIGWAPGAQQALDALASALQRVDLDGLVASEGRLSEIAAQLALAPPARVPLDPATRQLLETLQITLARCRRLGASLSDVVRLTHAAQGGRLDADVYGPHGSARPAVSAGAFQTQV
jgi:hypothetical protein